MSNPLSSQYHKDLNSKELQSWSENAIEELKLRLMDNPTNHQEINNLILNYNSNLPLEENHQWAVNVINSIV
tara:strand:- start:733 stop:948 length:216 start_codon:yes stop_codon:yes gene_type:complete